MIRFDRGPEPAALAALRDAELARIRALGRAPTSTDIGTRYKAVHDALWRAQAYKCGYCETREQSKRNDVEHYRPKARAHRAPGSAATHGYWWLAWTWENLLFACRNCNQSPAKLDKFPLDAGSTALVAEEVPPGGERPLLIDPATEDAIAHIQFVPETTTGRTRWRPRARGGSTRGAKTIEVCMLDRSDLLDLYTDHVSQNVEPAIADLRAAMTRGDEAAVHAFWARTTGKLLARTQVYVNLSYDALDHFVPAAERARWKLALDPPR
jgi:uncharacterized protein (TIGR02646 family)